MVITFISCMKSLEVNKVLPVMGTKAPSVFYFKQKGHLVLLNRKKNQIKLVILRKLN